MTIRERTTGFIEGVREGQENPSPGIAFTSHAAATAVTAGIAAGALTGQKTWQSRTLTVWAAISAAVAARNTFQAYITWKATQADGEAEDLVEHLLASRDKAARVAQEDDGDAGL